MSSPTPAIGRFRPFSADDFSRRSKNAAWLLQTPLQQTQEWLAQCYGYSGLHEIKLDLVKRAENPDQFPAGPTQEDLDEQKFAAYRNTSQLTSIHTGAMDRPTMLLRATSALKGDIPLGSLSRRDWKITDIGLFNESARHRVLFRAVKAGLEVLDGTASFPAHDLPEDYAYLDTDSMGRAILSFTPLGRAVFDALDEISQGESEAGMEPEACLTLLSRMIGRYPSNPWVKALYVTIGADAYWQGVWAHDIPDANGNGPYASDDVNPGYKKYARSFANQFLPFAHESIALFEGLYGNRPSNLADVDSTGHLADLDSTDVGGEIGADANTYPLILHYGGRLAMNAGQLSLASRWFTRSMKITPKDSFANRFPLSAVKLALGKGSASAVFPSNERSGSGSSWINLVLVAESMRDGKMELARGALIRALTSSPHALRAIDARYHATDECRVSSNLDHIVHFQEFFYRTKPFWKRHPEHLQQLREWVSGRDLRAAYKAMHVAKSKVFGIALKPADQRGVIEAAVAATTQRFTELAVRSMQVD